MKLQPECEACILAQVKTVADMLNLPDHQRSVVLKDADVFMETADRNATPPGTMVHVWGKLIDTLGGIDPYIEIKSRCNHEAMLLLPDAKNAIELSDDPLAFAMKYAIAGNLIDYSLKEPVTIEQQNARIDAIVHTPFAIDDFEKLRDTLKRSKTLLYLGDNTGEIVFDRLFIETILKYYPHLDVVFAVKGRAIMNDVLYNDAFEVGMDHIARIIDNGDGAPGTVMSRVSESFRREFELADVVISKGQGNYECLGGFNKENLFFLFTSKCGSVCSEAGVPMHSMSCLKNRIL
ncbi:MAG: ARMT1-like domain-containing protein [Eubacteriales bacterium]